MAESTTLTTQVKAAAGFGLVMSPQTLDETHKFCAMLANTEFVPKAFRGKPDSIMVVGAMGHRLGVDVFTAMAGIADINGKPSIYGDLMLAVCQNHPAFLDCIETLEGTPYADDCRGVCVVKRKGRDPVERSFSVADAKKANLWGKQGPWSATPQRMLQMRARSFALRDTFSDALAGFHNREEMEDVQEAEVLAVRSDPVPARTGVVSPEPATSTTQPAQASTSTTQAATAKPAALHPAIAAARDLFRSMESIEKGLGKTVIARLCALAGAAEPKGISADKLDQFGKDVAELTGAAGDKARILDLIGTWEHAAREAQP